MPPVGVAIGHERLLAKIVVVDGWKATREGQDDIVNVEVPEVYKIALGLTQDVELKASASVPLAMHNVQAKAL